MRRRRKGRSAAEYFLAAIGVAFLVFIAALVATSGSCRLRLSPEIGHRSPAARPAPTPTP